MRGKCGSLLLTPVMFHGKKVTVAVGLSFALVTCCHVLFILYQDAKLLLPLPLFAAITAPIPAYYQHRGVASISPSKIRLWKGDAVPTSKKQPDKPPQIHIVVSHCRHDLDWLPSFTAGVSIAKITVISKCDADVPVETLRAATAADDSSTNVLRGLPNLGRCDFNFAYMLSNVTTKQKQEQPLMEHHHLADDIMDDDANDLILFLKDDSKFLQKTRKNSRSGQASFAPEHSFTPLWLCHFRSLITSVGSQVSPIWALEDTFPDNSCSDIRRLRLCNEALLGANSCRFELGPQPATVRLFHVRRRGKAKQIQALSYSCEVWKRARRIPGS